MIRTEIIGGSKSPRGQMDRRERRHKRFLMLLAEADNSNTKLAELVGMSAGQVGQIKNSEGKFGNQVAAKLEKGMGKPDGWLDQWTTGEGGWDQPARTSSWHLIRLLDELPEDIRKSVSNTITASHRQAQPRTKNKKAR